MTKWFWLFSDEIRVREIKLEEACDKFNKNRKRRTKFHLVRLHKGSLWTSENRIPKRQLKRLMEEITK